MSRNIDGGRELGVEGLRGLAALMVVYTHLFAPFAEVDPGYVPSSLFWKLEAGQGAVLFFFVLSGYVIGITNPQPSGAGRIAAYGRRRAVRLVPLYVLALGLSVLVRPVDSAGTIVGNLLFLQNELPYGSIHVSIVASNTNLWSLNYEVLYYLLFPLVWLTARRAWVWLGAAAVFGVGGWALPVSGGLVASYAAGWAFWLAGYLLAKAPPCAPGAEIRAPWPSLALLWIVTWHVKPLWFFAHRFDLLPHGAAWMNYTYYDFIPCCVALLLVASGRRTRFGGLIITAALAIPVSFLLWRAIRGRWFANGFAIDDFLCIAAMALWRWRPSTSCFAKFASVGAVSYGIYIFQRPVQWFILQGRWLPSGSLATFLLRLGVILALTVIVAWLAERRLQPLIRRRLSGGRRAPLGAHQPAR